MLKDGVIIDVTKVGVMVPDKLLYDVRRASGYEVLKAWCCV